MKKPFHLLSSVAMFALMLCSCSIFPETPENERVVISQIVDFRPYTEANFLVTPDSYTGKYESIGDIKLSVYPARKYQSTRSGKSSKAAEANKHEDGIYQQAEPTLAGNRILVSEKISTDELTELLVQKAIELGGNAISNFKLNKIYNKYYSQSSGWQEVFSHYQVEGFCIKID